MNTEKTTAPKNMGIRAKLIAFVVPIVLIIIISFFALSRVMIVHLAEDKLKAESKGYAKEIYAWSDQILAELNVYKDGVENLRHAYNSQILDYMKLSVEKNEAYPTGLYMGDDKGTYLDASGWVPGPDWVLTERDWYKEGADHETIQFGEPYYDSQTGDMCVSASVRMSNQDVVRVLAADVYLDYVCSLMTEIAEGDEIKSFLATKGSRIIIAHPEEELMAVALDAEGIDRLYADVSKAIQGGQTGLTKMKGDNGTYFVCLNEIPGTDWMLVSYESQGKVLSKLYRMELYMVLIAAAAAAVLVLVSMRLMNGVVKPVARVTDVIQMVAEGDLTQNIEVKGNDEIGRMGAHVQSFLVEMRKTMSGISETAQWLAKQSEANFRVSDSLMESSKNQADAMSNLSGVVDELSAKTQDASRQMASLADVIDEAGEQSRQASEMMRETVEVSGRGQTAAKQVSASMKTIEETISSLSELVSETERAIGQISNMVGMIVSVANETNLLSLNAAIEAARAGEAGRGFAVVAEQIGKLAVSSGESADNISKLIKDIQYTMQRVVTQMQESVTEVQEGARYVGQTQATFGTVYDRIGEADRIVQHMTELIGKVEKVADNMERISESQVSSAGQIRDYTRKLDGYTHIVSSDCGTVAQSAEELEREAHNLTERVGAFRL